MSTGKEVNKQAKDLSQFRKFYEQLAERKGDTDQHWAKGFHQSLLIEKIHSMLNIQGKFVGDIGCGDGRTSIYLGERGNTVLGIDIAFGTITRAREKANGRSLGNNTYVQAYAEHLPIKQGVLDWIVCTEVLEHVRDDHAVLKELSDALRPGGRALISIPTVSLRRYFDMRYIGRPLYMDPEEHLREFTYHKIPWCEGEFVLIRDLDKKLALLNLSVIGRHGIGFELPLWVMRFGLGQRFDEYLEKP